MNIPSTCKPSHLSTQSAVDVEHQLETSSTAITASAFTNANDVRIKNSSLNITNNVNIAGKPTLEILYQRVAPNAILNEGRADDAKCHPGTREEVIGLIERWMDATESKRILWVSGPAGAGKTAIMKTITERSANRGVQTINFFFFRGDSTRTSAQPVVPTLLYQIFELCPPSSEAVARIISTRPRILDGSIAQQCKLISALVPIIRQSSPTNARIVLVVDGLDECDVDAERSQGDILRALEGLAAEDNSPFLVLVASRPEALIKLAFNRLPSQAETIFLDEEYLPEKDIRLFVTVEFDGIKKLHPSARSLPGDWPSSADVEEIVAKSSGQFIYAATVMRYLAHASTVPSLSLERVKGVVPPANNSPFTHLDSIYLFILSRVDDPDVMHNMLSMKLLQQQVIHDNSNITLQELLRIYDSRYNHSRVESCASELSAIIQLTAEGNLRFYHASLPDFLVDEARSGTYYIDVDAFRAKVLVVFWEIPTMIVEFTWRDPRILLFIELQKPTPGITHALLNLPFPDWTMGLLGPASDFRDTSDFIRAVQKLYYEDDVELYKHILRRFISILVSHNMSPDMDLDKELPYVQQYLLECQVPGAEQSVLESRRPKWWFRFLKHIGMKKGGGEVKSSII